MYKQKPALKTGFCVIGQLHVSKQSYCVGGFSTKKKAENYKLSVCLTDEQVIPFSFDIYNDVDNYINCHLDKGRKRW